MDSQSIISAIDAEIAKLEQVRELLAQDAGLDGLTRGRRFKKAAAKKAVKRTMSPEARKRIADAQRKRWAAAKKLKSAAPQKKTKKAAKAAPAAAKPGAPKAEAGS
jgi:hypothetical protein